MYLRYVIYRQVSHLVPSPNCQKQTKTAHIILIKVDMYLRYVIYPYLMMYVFIHPVVVSQVNDSNQNNINTC